MNEQQPYEKHLAEKFQQLPLPDVEPNWQQMKLLLDKEMPRGGGYWRWRTAFGILLFMLGGTWFFISRKEPGSLAGVGMDKHSESSKKNVPSNPATTSSSEQEVQRKDDLSGVLKKLPATTIDQQTQDLKAKNIDENLLKNNTNNSDNKTSETSKIIKADDFSGDQGGADRRPKDVDQKANNNPDGVSNKEQPTQTDERTVDANKFADNPKKSPGQAQVYKPHFAEDDPIKSSIVDYNPQNVIPGYKTDNLATDSINGNYSTIFPESVSENQHAGKLSGKTKSAKVSAIESVQNRVLAVGFSLPLGFPLGDQKPGAYNINAKPNTVTDFLPVPHLQYHLNNKVYLQTELQLLNPQFIRPVLLYERKTDVPSANTIYYNSIYAKKLYYFNIPVGIHYSPFPHFYLGTGLQFSSFISGVALHEQTSFVIGTGTRTLLGQQYEKFKNDSISDRIDNSEFRLMLDANYYWKQFTVGLRYNQALSNYVSFRLNNISPLLQDKNKSLQFYLRYNLWEDYKRKKGAKR